MTSPLLSVPASAPAVASQPAPSPGWQAHLSLGFTLRGRQTVLSERRQYGPLTVQRPFYPEGMPSHLYLLHPPGGVVGGDEIEVQVRVGEGAHALLTTPGATKFYRSAGPQSRVTQAFEVAAGGALEWLPQDNILFPGANLYLHSTFHLAAGARLLAWECLSLGRPVNRERFTGGCLLSRWQVYREQRLCLNESVRVLDDRDLDRRAGLAGYPLVATLLATPATEEDRERIRTVLAGYPAPAGVTLLGDLLVVRLLGVENEPLQQRMQTIWQILRPTVMGCPACRPRIWNT